ncbi:MAG: septum formation initiator family protein [Pseudomonadota bacterium]|nr:septum formation initiator family protein [Pseudomonadota bacterium]
MKKLYLALAILIVILQARLLSSDGGLGELFSLQEQLKTLESSLEEHRLLNAKLAVQVKALQENPLSIETLARQNLGMVKKDEVFIKIIELQSESGLNKDLFIDEESAPVKQDLPAAKVE